MSVAHMLNFAGESVATAYDEVLVPRVFEPWARDLVEFSPPRADWRVIDLATGTGVLAFELQRRLGAGGSLVGVDISESMLTLASARLEAAENRCELVCSSAAPLRLESDAYDALYCQQGFQFFPDRAEAAREMYRVLKSGGELTLSTWCTTRDCEIFGEICDALRDFDHVEMAAALERPFNYMPVEELVEHFWNAGFEVVCLSGRQLEITIDDPVDLRRFVMGTPIGPQMSELSDSDLGVYFRCLESRFPDWPATSALRSNIVVARKPSG